MRAPGGTLTAKLVVVTRTVPTPGWRNDATFVLGSATSCPAQVLAKAGLAASRLRMKWVQAGSPTCRPYAARSWPIMRLRTVSALPTGLQQAGLVRVASNVFRSLTGADVTRG